MTVTEFLQKLVPFLAGVTDAQAKAMATKAEQKRFKKGQTVLFKGVSVDGLHVMAMGKVSVHIKAEKSKEWLKVAELGPGDVFGEMSIVEFAMAGATVKAESDDTLIFVIPQDLFTEMMDADPGFKARVTQLIDARRPKAPAKPDPNAAKPDAAPPAAAPADVKPPQP